MNIVKILLVLVLIYLGYKIIKSFQKRKPEETKAFKAGTVPAKGEDLVQDPFCKTYVPMSQAYVKEIQGKNQYFCSQECCNKFMEEKKDN